MPTSSQSKILSVVDYQLLQQQQTNGQEGVTAKPSSQIQINQTPVGRARDERRSAIGRRDGNNEQSTSPVYRRNSAKINDSTNVSRTSQRNDVLHIPVVNINAKANIKSKAPVESPEYRPGSVNVDYPIDSSASDNENENNNDEGEENPDAEWRKGLLSEGARRLFVLGTIRPSRTFYRNLPASDVQYLMDYFQRMRNSNRKVSSEEINQELTNKSTEYKPKMFYDSATVTKSQVHNVEKFIEQYAEQLRNHQVELIKLDNPLRFIIKPIDNDTPLATVPRELSDCLITLISRSDPLRKSELVSELISEKLIEDVKANSLDISYFPGGVNYDVPCDEIDESGLMNVETYQKLKTRLNTRKVWYFSDPPEKRPRSLIAILPPYVSSTINHQRLLDCLYEHLKTSSDNEDLDIEQKILSIEFIPLSCILDSHEISDQFIIDCDSIETKQKLMDKPLKMDLKKQSINIELQSYDENMQREYNKSIKAERYRELIKNHDTAAKRTSNK